VIVTTQVPEITVPPTDVEVPGLERQVDPPASLLFGVLLLASLSLIGVFIGRSARSRHR
jgi:hypothetical protein